MLGDEQAVMSVGGRAVVGGSVTLKNSVLSLLRILVN